MDSATEATEILLVDSEDRVLGTAPKLRAHQDGGHLHRAVSVLVFDARGRTLLQQRALGKYHAGGAWSNTSCSHPRPSETTEEAAHRCLRNELGIDCPLTEAFTFTYRVDVGGGLTEYEYDHVFVGRFDGEPRPAGEEVADVRWMTMPELFATVRPDSKEFSPWFKILLVEWHHRGTAVPP